MQGINGLNGGLQAQQALAARGADQIDQLAQRADADIDVAANELETMFATLLVKEMRSGLSDGLFAKGPGQDIFEGWFDQHLGRALQEGGALELAGLVKVAAGRGNAAGAGS